MKSKKKYIGVVIVSLIIVAVIVKAQQLGLYEGRSMMEANNKKNIKIILGSTRQGRKSDAIAVLLQKMAYHLPEVQIDILDLRDYALPLLYESVSPMSRKEITDPAIKKWSQVINEADGFIIIVPEYNAGYPGVLKNALDLLYKEWNGKPVAFVGYSGGPSGGSNAIAQLRVVVKELQMKAVTSEILIPKIYNAFDVNGNISYITRESIEHFLQQLLT